MMSEKQYTFEDWLENTTVPATELSEDEQPEKKIPFHYALSHHLYAGLLQEKGLISDEEFQRISDEQQRVYNLLKESRLAAAKVRLQEDEENCRITIPFLQLKQEKLLSQLKEFSRYHEMRPTFHILEHANTQRDCSLLVDPDLYRLVLKDTKDGKPLKSSLIEPDDVIPPDLVESEVVAFYEKFVKPKYYPLPDEIAAELKPTYRVLVADQREALMFELEYKAISYEHQEIRTLITGLESGKIKTVNGRISRRGGNMKAKERQMPDEFFEEAKKLYQQNPKEALSQRKNGNASDRLLDQLEGKYRAYIYSDGKKVYEKVSRKTIQRRLNWNKDLWQVDG